MSWKMFWQIVLLLIAASVIMTTTKFGAMCLKAKYCPMVKKMICPETRGVEQPKAEHPK